MDIKSVIMIVAQLSLISLVAAVGLRTNWHDVLRTMRNAGLVLRTVLAVNVVVPLTAIIICGLLPIPLPIKVGIVIMAVSPPAPMLSARLLQAGVESYLAVGLDFALVLLSVIIVPLTIALLSWNLSVQGSISPVAVAKLAAISVLLPLTVGMLVRSLVGPPVWRLAKILTVLGYVGLGLVVVAVIYARGRDALELVGDGAVFAIFVTVLAGIAAGHSLAGRNPSAKMAAALAAALRQPGLAALIAWQNFPNQNVELTAVLYVATAAAVSLVYQVWMTKRRGRSKSARAALTGAG